MKDEGQLREDPIRGYDPWTQALAAEFKNDTLATLQEMPLAGMTLAARQGQDSLWLVARWPGGGGVAFRTAYSPGTGLKLTKTRRDDHAVTFGFTSSLGEYAVRVETPPSDSALLHWTVTLTPGLPTLLPFWPTDVYLLDAQGDPTTTRGTVHAGQAGLAGGFLYLTLTEPPSGSLLYLQNLSALNDLCGKTGTTPESRVGGLWPQLGYSPPPCDTQPLPAGEPTILSDAWARLSPVVPENDRAAARLFLDGLADIYPRLERPGTEFHDWPGLARKTLRDLDRSPKCTVRELGHRYLHPYTASEYPDSMVQLTVLLPILEYGEWTGKQMPLADDLRAGVPGFYDKKLATVRRYLPTVGKDKDADAVDSWYLYHPLANLGRLAKRGDAAAQDLFFNAMDFVIKVARHFQYRWPIQFNVRTLEVLTGDRKPGEPGQTDVGGLYAYVMLQAYDLSGGDRRFLREAEKAARALNGYRFSVAYQMNLTAWGANACLRLFHVTGDEYFRGQSEVLLASYFHHSMLWNSRLGFAKNYPIFLGALCLHDSPYMAIYECYESLAGFHEYLSLAGDDIAPSLRLLLTEYIKYTLDRAWFYYPAHLPKKALATEIRNGHIDRNLAIPLEDLYADGQPAGQVGQEVYGSGAAFALTTRAFHRLPDAPFLLYSEYPLADIVQAPDRCAEFTLRGDPRFTSRLRLIPQGRTPLPPVRLCVQTPQGETTEEGTLTPEGHREYLLPGGSQVEVRWT